MSGDVRRIVLYSKVGPEVTICSRRFLYFGGTDYLGMAGRDEVIRGAAEVLEKFGVSASAARTSSGTLQVHLELEKCIARFSGSESAVIYSSGYLGIAMLVSGLLEDTDTVFVQQDAHSSIMDGLRSQGVEFRTYELGNLDSLACQLDSLPAGNRAVVIGEGVSPLFGRIFPLDQIIGILKDREQLVLLDDAHGFGVLGEGGRGTAAIGGGSVDNVVTCATLSKAFGSFGGVIPVSRASAEAIQRNSMVYQCSTPVPAPICGGALAAFGYLEKHPELLTNLAANNRRLRDGLKRLGLTVPDSPAPIIPLVDCGEIKPQALSDHLYDAGILAPFTKYPGSPENGMVRLIVTAGHSEEQIGHLLDEIGRSL